MALPPAIASPDWVRVDAAAPDPWRMTTHARVVHLGHSALVVQSRRRQLVVTSDGFGLVPGGIQLRSAEFGRMRHALAAGTADLSAWSPAVIVAVDLSLPHTLVDADALAMLESAVADTDGGPFDPSRQRSEAPSLSAAAASGARLTGYLLRLIGAGPGSTPAGDDVVAGVLAGLHATGRVHAASGLGAQVLPLLERTTSASRLYLEAAADGRFAERVHVLVDGLRDEASAERAIRAAERYGATSGADLLAGIVAAARISLPIRKTA